MTRKKSHRREMRFITIIAVHVPMTRDCLDMMRYDSCFPSSEDETRKLWAMEHGGAALKDHLVQFTCVGRAENTPNVERWRSFGCTVFDVRSPAEPHLSDKELLEKWETYQLMEQAPDVIGGHRYRKR